MILNTRNSWGSVSKGLHWGLVLLVAAQVPLGFWLAREVPQARITGDDTLMLWLEFVHHSTGFVILFLAVTRISWRLATIVPDSPVPVAAFQKTVAKAVHIFFYVLMVLFPLSGWAASSLIGNPMFPVPINFFGLEMPEVPYVRSLPPPFNTFALYRQIHELCWWIGGGLLSLHILAALYHQFFLKDNLLVRMLPFLSRSS